MNPLLTDLQSKLSAEDFARLTAELAKYQPNSNAVKATVELADGTKLQFGIGRKSKMVRVYGLRAEGKRDLPVALTVESWHQLAEALPGLLDFIAKNANAFQNETPNEVLSQNDIGETNGVPEEPRRRRNRKAA
ncbi:MAG TPA: hypothetical protein VJN02_03145 [Gammaproteobacteria bacterium]|nr:hypothetical protein [Gammaproteobacteria bacterium]